MATSNAVVAHPDCARPCPFTSLLSSAVVSVTITAPAPRLCCQSVLPARSWPNARVGSLGAFVSGSLGASVCDAVTAQVPHVCGPEAEACEQVRNKEAGRVGETALQYEPVSGRYYDVITDGNKMICPLKAPPLAEPTLDPVSEEPPVPDGEVPRANGVAASANKSILDAAYPRH